MNLRRNPRSDVVKRLVDQEHLDAIEYVDLVGNSRILEEWIARRYHGKAEVNAKQIIERQRQLRDKQMNGLPESLQDLVDQVHGNATMYIGFAGDVRILDEWIANGDYGQAESIATQIIGRQRQIGDSQQKGFPFKLQKVVHPRHGNAPMYADSTGEVRSLDEWIANGDQNQADSGAKQVLYSEGISLKLN